MQVDFEEKGHVYAVNGEIATISVTELLAKHGLAPDYSKVGKATLKAKADKGKEIHKDLENILNKKKYEPKTEQGKQFKEWVTMNLDCGVGEQMLGFECEDMIVAGTADFMGILKDGSFIIGDHKTTSKFHREYVSWQVSLLDYFARKLGGELINGKLLNWKGATKFVCFHYNPDMKIYDLDKVPDSEIENLLDCELRGEKYQRPQLVVDEELKQRFLTAEQYLVEMERNFKQAEENAKKIREEMLSAFEKQGITKWESPNGKLVASYVPPLDTVRVDTTKLKKKYPMIYGECQKIVNTKAQIRIRLRDKEEE